MNQTKLKEEIRAFLVAKSRLQEPADESIIVGSGLIDSFGLVSLLADIETRFGVFPDLMIRDPMEFSTLGGMVGVILESMGIDASTISIEPESQKTPLLGDKFEIFTLSRDDSRWSEVPALVDEMYEEFADFGVRIPLVVNGAQIWSETMSKLPNSIARVTVVAVGGALVGLVSGYCKKLPAHLGGLLVGEISYLYVKKEVRRMGVAKALVQDVEGWLEGLAVDSIEIQVLTENLAARGFWKRRGFVDELVQCRRKWEI